MTDTIEPDSESLRPIDNTMPAPLLGCLYCHAEGSTRLVEARKLFGLGSGVPTLVCNSCGAVALFENGDLPSTWRIRYKKINNATRYYYAMTHFTETGWIVADEALEISRRAFVQRIRVQQAQRGDLDWLHEIRLKSPPQLMSRDEHIYLSADQVVLQTEQRESTPVDSGQFYVTDQKLHLLGARRDWSHKFADIQLVDYTETGWRIEVGTNGQVYTGSNKGIPSSDQVDGQLFTAIVKALMRYKPSDVEEPTYLSYEDGPLGTD